MNDYDLKQEIKKLGMTQKEFAAHFGLHRDTVSKWARGITETPEWAKHLIRLAHIEKKFNTIKTIISDELTEK